MKYKSVKDFLKAIENAKENKAAMIREVEKKKADIRAKIDQINSALVETKFSGNYERFESLSAELAKEKEKLKFYEECAYSSAISDEDICSSWNEVAPAYQAEVDKAHERYIKLKHSLCAAYEDYLNAVKEALKAQNTFKYELSPEAFNHLGFVRYDFTDILTSAFDNDTDIIRMFRECGLANKYNEIVIRGNTNI